MQNSGVWGRENVESYLFLVKSGHDARDEGAVYSPDGMRIQFDDGRVWQRDFGLRPVVVRRAPVTLRHY